MFATVKANDCVSSVPVNIGDSVYLFKYYFMTVSIDIRIYIYTDAVWVLSTHSLWACVWAVL